MKKALYTSILLLLSLHLFAQDPALFNNDWYINYLEIDGVTYSSPAYPPFPGGGVNGYEGVNFYEETSGDFVLYAQFVDGDAVFSPIVFNLPATKFDMTDPVVTLGGCHAFCDFEFLYLNFFFDTPAPATYEYEISSQPNGEMTLVITDPDGNIAVHGANILGTNEFNKDLIKIAPNPVSNTLQFTGHNNAIEHTVIYNITGQKIKEATPTNNSIDVSELVVGIYFIEMTMAKRSVVQKFIKK